MAVGLLLVMHPKLGRGLLDTLIDTLGTLPLPAQLLEVPHVDTHEALLEQGMACLETLDQGAGVLILSDVFGATPSNIAHQMGAARPQSTVVIAGANLPMLLRICNYAQQPLAALATLAVEGGQRGITLNSKP